jgi:hypothetical protein
MNRIDNTLDDRLRLLEDKESLIQPNSDEAHHTSQQFVPCRPDRKAIMINIHCVYREHELKASSKDDVRVSVKKLLQKYQH